MLQSSPAPATIGRGFGEGEFMSCQGCARKAWVAVLVLGWMIAGFALPAAAQKQAEVKNMNLAGYSDLQGRSSYQPSIHKQGSRWIAYIGHHGGSAMNPITGKMEDNGTSIVDVTDPKQPKYLAHIPGDPRVPGPGETGGAQMTRLCDGADLPHANKSKVYLLRTKGTDAHEMWDVTDPAHPNRLTVILSGLVDTHKSWWECDSGIALLVSGKPGWRAKRMMQVYDLSDPSNPCSSVTSAYPASSPARPASNPAICTAPFPPDRRATAYMPATERPRAA